MAPKTSATNKRKQNPNPKSPNSKKPKLIVDPKSSNPTKKPFKKPLKIDANNNAAAAAPLSKREGLIRTKELAEARKKKRKKHYSLEQELARLWEKMRQRNIAKEERSKLVSEALKKMKGKIPEIAGSHVSSRILQTCVKYCSQAERDEVYEELRPHFLTLACNTYAVHLVKKMLDGASKKHLSGFISNLRGHVAPLLRHMVGSVVVEHAYQLANATQKQELLKELYSTELQLFKDLASMKETRLLDIISKLSLQKTSVLRHMTLVIQPILEKGIVDHSIIHKLLTEYLTVADKISAADIVQQLSGPLLVRMIHTRDGSRIGMLCVRHGSAKERKKIIKGMKDHVGKIAHDQCGAMVLACIFSIVDDTKLVSKVIIRELLKILKELIFDKNGRRPLLQLLHPNCSRVFSPDDLASFNITIPSLCEKVDKLGDNEAREDLEAADEEDDDNEGETHSLGKGGKKDPKIRRKELLVDSGLAESLVDVCIENASELLRSNIGKEVIYEVVIGGADGILHPGLDNKLNDLREAIASVAAKPKSEEVEEEHIFENFHSSRVIRKLVMDCPAFASILWEKALKGNCRTWVEGHSCKVIHAFLESSDSKVRELAKPELQPLIDEGVLKTPEKKQS